jgi:hypothetical protein
MSDPLEQARDAIEEAHREMEEARAEVLSERRDHSARNTAILIAALAASLALTEMGEKASQNLYLTHHISVTDTWAFYQVRNVRATTMTAAADIIESQPSLTPEAKARADRLRTDAARQLDDPKGGEGRKQLGEKAKQETEQRDHAFHAYHKYELATGALQIAIVLASVSIATKMKALTYTAALIGGVAALFGLAVSTDVL